MSFIQTNTITNFNLNKKVELLKFSGVEQYDEELFTSLFDITKKIEIRKICIWLRPWLSDKFKKNICAKIEDKIPQDIFSNEVSSNIKLLCLNYK